MMNEILLPCDNAREIMHNAKDLKIIGKMTLQDVKSLAWEYEVLDLSESVFEEEREEYEMCLGWSHCGPVYGATRTRTVDVLKVLLERTEVFTLILPDDVARRHMNTIAKNDNIYNVQVRDTCKLFSMRGADVFNKKGTVLIFKHRERVYIKCDDCGDSDLAPHMFELADGRHVCSECRYTAYNECSCCGKIYPNNQIIIPKHVGYLFLCPVCAAKYEK